MVQVAPKHVVEVITYYICYTDVYFSVGNKDSRYSTFLYENKLFLEFGELNLRVEGC